MLHLWCKIFFSLFEFMSIHWIHSNFLFTIFSFYQYFELIYSSFFTTLSPAFMHINSFLFCRTDKTKKRWAKLVCLLCPSASSLHCLLLGIQQTEVHSSRLSILPTVWFCDWLGMDLAHPPNYLSKVLILNININNVQHCRDAQNSWV